jgi:hypothetical protein
MTVELTIRTYDLRRFYMHMRYRADRDGYSKVVIWFIYAGGGRLNRMSSEFVVHLPGHPRSIVPFVIS